MTGPVTETDTNTWRGVRDELLRRIHTRQWPPGSAVPNEADLAAEFGCARTTVNRAMRALAEAGLVDRRRKAGTRVAEHPAARVVLDIPVIRLEVEQRGAAWRQDLLDSAVGPAPAALAADLGLPADAQMRHVRALHFADDQPFLLEDRWINLAAVPLAESADFAAVSSNEWLLRTAPYTGGDIAFSAESAAPALARLLGCPPGAALFTVDRVTRNGTVPITSVRLSYAPGYRMHTGI